MAVFRATANLWHVSLNWPKPETIAVALMDSDTGHAILEKVKRRVSTKAVSTGMADKFACINSNELDTRFYLHFANEEGFHRIDPKKSLEHYKIRVDADGTEGVGRLLYMRILSMKERADDLWPESESDAEETVAAVTGRKRQRQDEWTRKQGKAVTDNDCLVDTDEEQEEEIVELKQHGGFLSKAELKCVYSGMTFTDAQHNRSTAQGCRHHLDCQSLDALLQVVHRDTKKKTAQCPVAGCSGTWTKLRSRPDPAFQALVIAAVAYHGAQEGGSGGGGGGGGGGGAGLVGPPGTTDVIELD